MTLSPPRARFAICLLEDEAGRLLFLRRAADRTLGANQWGFPAGHLEGDESPEDCARRELREEIGPAHELRELRRLPPRRDSLYGGVYEVHLFHYRWLGGAITLNHEHTAHRWLDAQEFSTLEAIMPGVDEDIRLFDLWPLSCLNPDRLPEALGGRVKTSA